MAKIFRFSGYYVELSNPESIETFEGRLEELADNCECDVIQQLHIEESEEFDLDGEEEEDCDLALLARHFKCTEGMTEFDRPLPQKGEVYRHFKVGKCVTVIGVSRHTETEEVTVVYEHGGTIWNRPLEMFMSEVNKEKYPDATQKYRFEKAEGNNE